MKTRIVALLLGIVFLLSALTGCDAKKENDIPNESTPNETPSDPSESPTDSENKEPDHSEKPIISEQTPCTVTFNAEGAYTETDAQTVRKDHRILKPKDPKRVGYIFEGWSYNGEPWDFLLGRVASDMTLTAIWTPIPYTEGLEYTLLDDDTYSVAIGTATNESTIHVPPTYNGKAVTQVAQYGFADAKNLLSIIIPNSVTRIHQYAFSGCDNIQSMTLPFIGREGNSMLFYIFGNPQAVPRSIKKVVITGDYPINDLGICLSTGVREAAILSGTYVGQWSFYQCDGLTDLHLPSTLERIHQEAFYGCGSLSEITLPASMNYIGDYAFAYCYSLEKIIFKGTMAQWEAIEKGKNWLYLVENCRVSCTDGEIAV